MENVNITYILYWGWKTSDVYLEIQGSDRRLSTVSALTFVPSVLPEVICEGCAMTCLSPAYEYVFLDIDIESDWLIYYI